MRWLLVVLLCGGCAFEMPHSGSAREDCERYVDELLVRGQECASSTPAALASAEAEWRGRCAKVVAVNPLGETADGCIERARTMACEVFTSAEELPWCHAFLEAK